MDEDKIKQIATEIADARIKQYASDSRFGVYPVVAHAHTGVESAQINGTNLVGPILARIASTTSTASPTPPANGIDIFSITAQTVTAAFQPPKGNPVDGSLLRIRVTSSNGATARALTFSSATGGYIANSPALPSATTTGKTSNFGFEYDASNSVNKWRLLWSSNS